MTLGEFMTKDKAPKSPARLRLPRQPNLVIAVVVFASGFLAIKYSFPTVAGCTTLAGSLFGAGAAFIGAWVADRNRMTFEESEKSKHQEAAIKFLAPELARIAGRLVERSVNTYT
jgi:hypothetical protein